MHYSTYIMERKEGERGGGMEEQRGEGGRKEGEGGMGNGSKYAYAFDKRIQTQVFSSTVSESIM